VRFLFVDQRVGGGKTKDLVRINAVHVGESCFPLQAQSAQAHMDETNASWRWPSVKERENEHKMARWPGCGA